MISSTGLQLYGMQSKTYVYSGKKNTSGSRLQIFFFNKVSTINISCVILNQFIHFFGCIKQLENSPTLHWLQNCYYNYQFAGTVSQ